MGGARLAPACLLAGLATAVGTVAVHQWWWGLLLGAGASLLTELATPAGWWTRLPYAAGYAGVVGLAATPRGAGDYLVSADGRGYAVVGVALVVVVLAVATLPRPGRREFHRVPGGTPTLE